MDLNVDRLTEVLKTVGCEIIVQGNEYYVMLPDNFPWYSGDNIKDRNSSRIVATITLSWGEWKWTDAWPTPAINVWNNEPFGIEMRKGCVAASSRALDELRDFNYEQIAAWLQNKIGEVGRMAKEFRKKLIEYQSKEYEV